MDGIDFWKFLREKKTLQSEILTPYSITVIFNVKVLVTQFAVCALYLSCIGKPGGTFWAASLILTLRQSSVIAFIYASLPVIQYATKRDCLQSFIEIYTTTRQIGMKTVNSEQEPWFRPLVTFRCA